MSKLAEVLQPLYEQPAKSAVLLDVDGTLAAIEQHAEDAYVPESTRTLLIELARRYGFVACVSGRRAADARRIVGVGTIAYLGNHGTEIIHPGSPQTELNRTMEAWAPRVQKFVADHLSPELRQLRVRTEEKGAIVALHWRAAPDEQAAQAAVEQLVPAIEGAGLKHKHGRKVLEIRPPVTIDKGAGIVRLLKESGSHRATYIGDDLTDLDAFRGLAELQENGQLEYAIKLGVESPEQPPELAAAADLMVPGPEGVRAVLRTLLKLRPG